MHIEGPIATHNSLPYGSAMMEGCEPRRLMDEFDYIEQEFFIWGTANIYGPEPSRPPKEGSEGYALRPLSTLKQSNVPYKTRVLVIRPRAPKKFSGIAHVIPFHNLYAEASVELFLLRRGDAWVAVEVCAGTRFGPEEIPSGGVANLHRENPDRYRDLAITGGDPRDWDQLTSGALGRAFKDLNMGAAGPGMEVFSQELFRSYAQGPDIFFDVVNGLRTEQGQSVLSGLEVKRIYSSAASGGTQILCPLIEYHHDKHLLPDGRPPVDGYLIMVGLEPANGPKGAVAVVLKTEAEALRQSADLPKNSDDPPFRYYEIPGCGHVSPLSRGDHELDVIANVLPPGITGLSERSVSAEYRPYDKSIIPMVWALWDAMYRWVDEGNPMPTAPPITRDPHAPDGIARDEHGNALGGLRTPWVDVPNATYIARISPTNPLLPGMTLFTTAQMRSLYGSRRRYERKIKAQLEELIRDRFLLSEDAELMFSFAVGPNGQW